MTATVQKTRVTALPGDGIGPEVMSATMRVLEAAGAPIEWEVAEAGAEVFKKGLATGVPRETLESITRNRLALKSPLETPVGYGEKSANVTLRKYFELYANMRPVRELPGVVTPFSGRGIDMVIVRENTQGFQPDRNTYAGTGEFRPSPDMTISVRIITRHASERIARAAFEIAKDRPRKKVTAVHKETIFKLGCGMFAEECRKVAAQYPDIEYEEVMVDTFALRLVMKPQQYDVIVTTNMFGDIFNDEAAGLVCGLGMTPRLNTGERHAMAQAPHGSAPDIAGQNIANPYSMIMSGHMMLVWLAQTRGDDKIRETADVMQKAADIVVEERLALTRDMGGTSSTVDMGDAFVETIRSRLN
jgi:3-isopropylmalate dehydrogenase